MKNVRELPVVGVKLERPTKQKLIKPLYAEHNASTFALDLPVSSLCVGQRSRGVGDRALLAVNYMKLYGADTVLRSVSRESERQFVVVVRE